MRLMLLLVGTTRVQLLTPSPLLAWTWSFHPIPRKVEATCPLAQVARPSRTPPIGKHQRQGGIPHTHPRTASCRSIFHTMASWVRPIPARAAAMAVCPPLMLAAGRGMDGEDQLTAPPHLVRTGRSQGKADRVDQVLDFMRR